MKSFTLAELLNELPQSQKEVSANILSADSKACMICGENEGRQLLMNGLPSQLCDDCIDIQKEMHGSEIQEICGNCLHPVVLYGDKTARRHVIKEVPLRAAGNRTPRNGTLITNECREDSCTCTDPVVWHWQ